MSQYNTHAAAFYLEQNHKIKTMLILHIQRFPKSYQYHKVTIIFRTFIIFI